MKIDHFLGRKGYPDDHLIVRRGLKQILAESPDAITADEAGNWLETLAKTHYRDCDLVIMGIFMPGITLARCRTNLSGCRIGQRQVPANRRDYYG